MKILRAVVTRIYPIRYETSLLRRGLMAIELEENPWAIANELEQAFYLIIPKMTYGRSHGIVYGKR